MSELWQTLRSQWAREQIMMVALIVAYVLTGKLGLAFSYGHPAASLIWPPSGIALGACIIFGYRVWPAILVGAVLLFASTIGPSFAVVAMAAGNTVEALTAGYLINRYAGGRQTLQTPRNSLRFAGIAVVTGTSIGPTIGVTTLVLAGHVDWSEYAGMWGVWALGSVSSGILVAPVVMLFAQGSRRRWKTPELVEAVSAQMAILVIGLVVFCGFMPDLRGYPLELLCVPVLLWVALRVGRRAAVGAVVMLTALAVLGTVTGYGPFLRATPTAGLAVTQAFMSVLGVMTLALAALASEYSSAETQLRELVVTDPLTGLPNYRRLIEVLSAEMVRSDRYQEPFAVVFFDMDGLKEINDELGHLTGSRAVCRLAETLKATCRATDTPARYGGDEFVAVLPATDEDGARLIIDRLETRLVEDPDEPRLSVSAGVSIYPRDGSTPTTLLSAADRALYAAKAIKLRERGVVPLDVWTKAGA
jgi:diguanylate cyclase (GGDEF)-like protein